MSRRKVKGHTEGKRHLRKISIGFDLDTFNYICNMAEADNTSFSETVRTLVEWGIEGSQMNYPPIVEGKPHVT